MQSLKKKNGIKLQEQLRTQGTTYTKSLITVNLSSHSEESDYLRIIKFETMTKAPVKFQKSQHKMVGGVAHTWYTISDLVTLIVMNV